MVHDRGARGGVIRLHFVRDEVVAVRDSANREG